MNSKSVRLKNGEKASLRPYRDEDKEELVKLYASFSREALRWSLPPYDRARIERWTVNLDQSIILLALHGEGRRERVVGHLQIMTQPGLRLQGIGELFIYVHQDFQDLGLGTGMMEEGIRLARERGLRRIGLSVVADNKPAIRVYEKEGFQHEGRRKDAYFGEDGLYHDQVEMGLVL